MNFDYKNVSKMFHIKGIILKKKQTRQVHMGKKSHIWIVIGYLSWSHHIPRSNDTIKN